MPEQRITALEGGESVEGFRVAYTPGHASHHVCYLDEDTGDAYVGDMAGVRIPPGPTRWRPRRRPTSTSRPGSTRSTRWPPGTRRPLGLTHFGQVTDVEDQLADPHRAARAADSARLDGRRAFMPRWSRSLSAATDAATMESYEQAAAPDQLYMGLERYWRKRPTR